MLDDEDTQELLDTLRRIADQIEAGEFSAIDWRETWPGAPDGDYTLSVRFEATPERIARGRAVAEDFHRRRLQQAEENARAALSEGVTL